MLELTKEQIQQLVDTIESKQDCHCSVSNSMRTIWITSSDGENELRVAFLGNFALVLSRVEFAHKRCGTITAILFAVNYPHLKEGACSPAGLQSFPTRRTVRHGFRPCYRVQWAFTAVAGGIAWVRIGLCGIQSQ